MDPSILKLLEEDEDELMHSGPHVDAFTADLNRDIGGAGASCSQPSHSYFSVLSQENNQTSNQMYPHWQPSNQDENKSNRYRQRELFSQEREEQQSSEMKVKEHASGVEVQREVNGSQTPGGPPVEHKPMQIVSNQQGRVPEQVGHSANHAKQIPFASLLPIILPELDRDRASQLNTLSTKLRRNEIDKNGFARNAKGLVGADRLRWAVDKMHANNQETGPNQFQAQLLNPMQNHLRPPSGTATQFSDAYPSGQLHQKAQNTPTMTVMQSQKNSGHHNVGNNGFKSRQVERLTDPHGKQATKCRIFQQSQCRDLQHLHFPQGSSPMYGASSYNPYPGTNVGKSSTIVRPQSYDLQMRQVQCHQEVGSTHTSGTSQVMNVHKVEQQNSFSDPGRPGVPGATMPNMSAACSTSYNSGTWQPMHQITSASPMNGTGDDPKVSAKKLCTVQKNPLDAHGSSAPLPSKKQKVSGALVDQSMEHLNDVTAVSGVNLREEEEQLLSGSKDDSRVSEASRKAVQEEEDRLILQKMPLLKKLAEIMTKCGLKDLSNDVERCLSLCVEERLRGLISALIRVSKQRVDSEKTRHNTVVTSDIRGQILAINRKAREEWQKKQAGVEKLRKYNDSNSNTIIDADKEKDEERGKLVKSNKVEDDKMRATAANVAARAAVGGDDILSKWQLMAQARQKDGKKFDLAYASERGKDANNKQLTTSTGNAKDIRAACRRDQPNATSVSGMRRQFGGSQVTTPRPRVSRNISLKDVLVVLEREPQMAKSTGAYRLHEERHANA